MRGRFNTLRKLILIIFIVATAWQLLPRKSVNAAELGSLAMSAEAAARAIYPTYTVDSSAKASVTAGTYANIVVNSGFDSIVFPSGVTTIVGGAGQQLITPFSTNLTTAPITIGTSTSASTLVLGEGTVTGSIAMGPNNRSRYVSTLLIGNGENTGGKVEITGTIIGYASAARQARSVLRTNGADLVVNGSIGRGLSATSTAASSIGILEAANGDITTTRYASALHQIGSLDAYTVIARDGRTIDIGEHAQMAGIFLYPNATFITRGLHTQDGSNEDGGRIDIHNIIDGGSGGLLSEGSKLTAESDSIYLWKGISQGSGTITSGYDIVASQRRGNSLIKNEEMIKDVSQGTGKLVINAGKNIALGNITAESVSAGGDIVAGSEYKPNFIAPAGRIQIFPEGIKNGGTYAPRAKIVAKSISAPSGGIYAGDMDIIGGDPSLVEAKNLVVVQEAGSDILRASDGNFTLTNGTFKLTGTDLGAVHGVDIPWGARVDGNFTVTSAGDNEFVTMNVGKEASMTGGTVTGNSLHAGSAKFTDLLELTLNLTDELKSENHPYALETVKNITGDDTTTGDITISGDQKAYINTAKAAGSASITGGTYEGETLIANDSASFIDTASINLTGSLEATTGDITIRGDQKGNINRAKAGGSASITGGTYEGGSLSAKGNASFIDTASINLTGSLEATTGDITVKGQQDARVNAAKAGGNASITGGTYEGETLIANDSASFTDVAVLDLSGSLEAGDVTISGNDSAKVATLTAKGVLTMDSKAYSGTDLSTGGNASLSGLNSLQISGTTDIGGKLQTSATGDMSFKNLKVGEDIKASGGKFIAETISTGNKEGAAGDFTMTNGSFAFGGEAGGDNTIKGNLYVTGNSASSFANLGVKGEVNIAGGTVTGTALSATQASFDNLDELNVSDTLKTDNDLSVQGNSKVAINKAAAGGAANISGQSYAGSELIAAQATFTNLKDLEISYKLESSGDIGITLQDGGTATVEAATAGNDFSLKGGTFKGDSMTAKGNVVIDAVKTVNMDNAAVDGTLALSGGGVVAVKNLGVGQNATITDTKLQAGTIETGTTTGSGGDVTVKNGSFEFGGADAAKSAIHGNLLIDSKNASSFGELAVDGNLEMGGGYLEGTSLSVKNGIFKNFSLVQIDSMTLGGDVDALEIEDGSVVVVREILNPGGQDAINGSGLIIAGDPADPDSWSKLGDVDITDGMLEAEKALVEANSISGYGQGDLVDDIKAHQLVSGNINIENANIQLSGLSTYASKVNGDLKITANGDTRLGDIHVTGVTDISGGSVNARQFTTDGPATFTNTSLTLLGAGDKASFIGSDLTLADNSRNALGDIKVGGKLDASSGTVEAGVLETVSDAVFNGVELTLAGQANNPGSIGGNLDLVKNPAASLGVIQVKGNLSAEGGTLNAASLKVDKDATLTGVGLELNGTIANPDSITGNFTLKNNQGAKLGSLNVGGAADVESGNLSADSLSAGSIVLSSVQATIQALSSKEESFINDGTLKTNRLTAGSATFNSVVSEIGEADIQGTGKFSKGKLTASTLSANDAQFDDGIKATFEKLLMKGGGGIVTVGSAVDTIGKTTVDAASLQLNGSTLYVGNVSVEPAAMAVGNFITAEGLPSSIDGNIGVGPNGRLVLGSRDVNWIPSSQDNSSAILAMAQPMRLGSGMGIHVTGLDNPSPTGGNIRFDADSLFIIDGSNARIYYTGKWIPTTQLTVNNGAVGAISADTGVVNANVGQGAQIYIRNPQVNTIIVALGQNISTKYDDAAASRAGGGSPWTDANLNYDNKDKVKIERLDGDYAGQFSVLPITQDTPDNPSNPDNPVNPDNPNTPVNPDGPDNPDNPDNPNNPSNPDDPDNPDNPDNPNTPVNPDDPDNPDNPDNPNNPSNPDDPDNPDNPDNPDTPGTPTNPDMPDNPGSNPDPVTPASPNHPANTHPNADPGIHDVIKNETENGNVGPEPKHLVTHNGAGFLSYTIRHENPHEATRLVEGSLRMIILGGVPQMTLTANDAGQAAMEGRLGMFMREDDLHARSIALWAVPLYRTTNAWSLEAGNHDYDYHGGIGGIAIGGDVTYNDSLRAGLSFNIGAGYSKSGGSLTETTNNMNFWGVGAYGGWQLGNFGLSADVSFTSSYNKLKQEIGELADWSELKTDATAYAVGAGMTLDYRIKTALLDITPHAGIKYHFLHVNDYDIKHKGYTIVAGESFDQNIWTFPLGVRLGNDFEFANGWSLKPSIDLRVIPAAGDIDAKTSTRFTGTSQNIELKTKIMDYFTFGGAAGLEASIGNFTLGINYSVDAGAHTTINTVSGLLRYEF